MSVAIQSKSARINQALADRLRFELTPNKWDAFQAALERPVKPKPKLKRLLSEPGLLG